MRILFENFDWVFVEKPPGMSTHGASLWDMGTQEFLEYYHKLKTFVVSRLDKETSGVLVLAKTKQASAEAQRIHETGKAIKTYYFLTHQKPEWSVLTESSDLDGKECETFFTFQKKINGFYLIQAKISRGRYHQIRRHSSLRGIPVLGDLLYGGMPYDRLCLHCQSVSWPSVESAVESSLPLEFIQQESNPSPLFSAISRRLGVFTSVCDSWRILNRGEWPQLDISIDRYGNFLCCWNYTELTNENLAQILQPQLNKISHLLSWEGIVFKRLNKDPHNKGWVSSSLCIGNPPPPFFEANENGLSYSVTLTEDQHVGLFLDQRDNRVRVQKLSQGMRVANLFAYTCSFSQAALKGGAAVVYSVDIAPAFLEIGKSNILRNELAGQCNSKFIKDDVRVWLQRQINRIKKNGVAEKFDVVVCDPPTFSTVKKQGVFSVSKEWSALAAGVSQILSPTGTAFFSTNFRGGNKEQLSQQLEEYFSTVQILKPPIDFPSATEQADGLKQFLCKNPKLG